MKVALSLAFMVTLLALTVAEDVNKYQAIMVQQLMMQQLNLEEKTRNSGQSGIKQVRVQNSGTRPYLVPSFARNSVASIHDHANNVRTVGMGEFVGVLNGVEFRTRHNDYRLYMPSKDSKEYNKVEPIPFPDVPTQVSNKETVEEQISEMREYFRAWKEQNVSIRDYRPYFKANLCYLEGAWTKSSGAIEESFDSDRHFIDASSWNDLLKKIRFTSNAGRKSPLENFAFLPTKIMDLINGTIPDVAQWNYRILCQPLKDDLPLNAFRVVDDWGSRLKNRRSESQYPYSRAARFQLSPFPDASKPWPEEELLVKGKTLLDILMEQVPGKDNGKAQITDDAFGDVATEALTGKRLNSGYYHRWYEFGTTDAMGLTLQRRGYSDDSVFMAQTTNPKVAAESTSKCSWKGQGKNRKKICQTWKQHWSWAVPMEIIYTTPLNTWNPLDIEYKGDERLDDAAKTVRMDANGNRRNGNRSPDKAYNGTNSKLYYITPDEFYSGKEVGSDAADTSRKGGLAVLNKKGDMVTVRASGTRIFLPNILGIGSLRTRYPIMPLHAEGNLVMKELEAVKDIVKGMLREKEESVTGNNGDGGHVYVMSPSNTDKTSLHQHTVVLSGEEVRKLNNGETVKAVTSQANGHEHTLILRIRTRDNTLIYVKCGDDRTCWDKHGKDLVEDTPEASS